MIEYGGMQDSLVASVFLIGGSGFRFDKSTPKQYLVMKGMPLFIHAATALEESKEVGEIVFVCQKGDTGKVADLVKEASLANKKHIFVEGGNSRQESCLLGLEELDKEGYPADNPVLVVDGDRPNLLPRYIEENINNARRMGASVTAIPSSDSVAITKIKGYLDGYIPREEVMLLQTPQCFRFGILLEAEKLAKEKHLLFTDEGSLVLSLKHVAPAIVLGSKRNLKITTKDDAEAYIGEKE